MDKKITKEKLIIKIAKAIKERAKNNKSTEELPIRLSNWVNGAKVWCCSDVILCGETYRFTDQEVTEKDFLALVATALKESNVNAKLETEEYYPDSDNWWHSRKECRFKKLIITGKPCKEYMLLNRLLLKHTGKQLTELSVYTADVCGKRNSWSTSNYGYLEYQPEKCKKAIAFLRETKKTGDVVSFNVVEELDKGDDYEHAMYYETEWYGSQSGVLKISVSTPNGKERGTAEVYAYTKC